MYNHTAAAAAVAPAAVAAAAAAAADHGEVSSVAYFVALFALICFPSGGEAAALHGSSSRNKIYNKLKHIIYL